jgi:hypothetical protein
LECIVDTDLPSPSPSDLTALVGRSDAPLVQQELPLHDALHAWCRQCQGETHRWVAHDPARVPA